MIITETGSGSARATTYHDLLNKLVSALTSRHVATVAINAAGTGYAVGEIITLTHAGAHLDAKFEVTSISGGGGTGPVTGLQIISSGAFGDRPNGSITISAGGTGYAASRTDIVLEIQGGSSRCPAKVLATTDGSGVVTSAVAFEDLGTGGLGVYSTLPTYPAATTVEGPENFDSGSGCTITMGGSTGIIGTTALATTSSASGTGLTVDITLVETGWTVDDRNSNNHLINSVGNEKTVVLVGDAVGVLNKPFIAYRTATTTSGLTTRHQIGCFGLIAHNPALLFTEQDGRSPNNTAEGLMLDGGAYILMPEDSGAGVDEVDFWISADDTHVKLMTQIEESAIVSDNGIYGMHYNGLMDRVGTETESPYPFLCFAQSRIRQVNPKIANANITSIAENRHPSSGCGWFYDYLTGSWRDLQNDDTGGTPSAEEEMMVPFCIGRFEQGANSQDQVVTEGSLTIVPDFAKLDRSSATSILRKIPGTVDQFFLWPLTVIRKPTNSVSQTEDGIFGNPKGVFWISSDDGSGNRIANFSEDYITVNGKRYLIFHNHVHIEPYQYIAVEMDA